MTSPPSDHLTPTALDQRIEIAVGYGVEEMHRHRDARLLDAPHAALAVAHRDLVAAERDVAFCRARLARLASSEMPVDQVLFARIQRTLDQLAKAAAVRDTKQAWSPSRLPRLGRRHHRSRRRTSRLCSPSPRAPSCMNTSSPTVSRWRLPRVPASPTPSCSTWRRWAWWRAPPRTRCRPGSPSPSPMPAAAC